MKVLGIDEAGRGALVGPLVVGGFLYEGDVNKLKEVGVKDSKLLSPQKRSELYEWLKANGEFATIHIEPREIDFNNSVGVNLTELEVKKMMELIHQLKPDKVVIDCPSVNDKKMTEFFKSKCDCVVVCEHKADLNYPIAGAGSILAKHERDLKIQELEKELGVVIGAGYPSDERTINFARECIKNNKWLNYMRHSWDTYSRLKGESEQRGLGDWA